MRRQNRFRVIGALGGYLIGADLIVMITGSGEGAQGFPFLLVPALSGIGFWAGRGIDRDKRLF